MAAAGTPTQAAMFNALNEDRMEKNLNIPEDQEYALRKQTQEERDRNDNNEEIPEYRIQLDLSQDEEEQLTKNVKLEFEALKKEREASGLEKKWEMCDRQYDGELEPNKTLAFNLHVHQSKIKSDAIVRALNESFLDSDPMFDISPRPEMGRKDGFIVAEKQTQFLDFAVDEEIKPEVALTKINKSTVNKFVGIGKICWEYRRERRKREETYEGKNEPIGVGPNQELITINKGLQRFLNNYPEALSNQKGIVKQLIDEKKVNLVVEYKDVVDNNPELKYINLKNFYVRNGCEYQKGLSTEHLIAERETYTYWELKEKEDTGEFKDIKRLFNTQAGNDDEIKEDYKVQDYDVIEATTYFEFKGEEIKIKAWFGEKDDDLIYLGGILYPYYGFDTDYLAFYVNYNDCGFYGDAKSVLHDLKDSNIAQDVLLNLMLHGQYVRNILTPIVQEGSEMEELFLDKKFEYGAPITVDERFDDVNRGFGFVQWPSVDTNGSMLLIEKLKRIDGDVSRVSDLTTGGESQLDPSAPASKTIALLEQSGIGIKDYIRNYLPTFNTFATVILQIYYQMSHDEKKYNIVGKSKSVTGANPFETINREDMIAKTNVQSRAASFVFNKVNEKQEAFAAYQLVKSDPYAMQQPEIQFKALKVVMDTFGDRWKAISDNSLLSPEDFKKKQEMVALKAIQMLFQQAQEQAQTTGVAPNPEEVMQQAPGAITRAQAENYNPALAEEEE